MSFIVKVSDDFFCLSNSEILQKIDIENNFAETGKKYLIAVHYIKVIFKFVKTYILKLGILDGVDGLRISYLQSLYVNETYRTLRDLQ